MTLADDLKRMEHLPGNVYNFHPGSHTGQGMETGIAQIAETLNAILTPGLRTTVLLETMSGKGSEVGSRFEELREIIDRVALSDKLGVCLDTCHVSDAGYDIADDLDGVLTEFDRVIGLERLKRSAHQRQSEPAGRPQGSPCPHRRGLPGCGGAGPGGAASRIAGLPLRAGDAQRASGLRPGDRTAEARCGRDDRAAAVGAGDRAGHRHRTVQKRRGCRRSTVSAPVFSCTTHT